jgi:two-component system capsular synthesis response regulator RcsB
MFKKVLIAEDHQSTKFSVEQTLKNLGISESQYVYYCDDALSRLKRSNKENDSFELLITDLSFVDDGREQTITNGSQLIKEVKSLQPHIKVLVFSAESNPAVIRNLFEQFNIDGYVCKGRHDAIDLNNAILTIADDKKYIPLEFRKAVRDNNTYDFDDFDTIIISQLALGVKLKDIPTYLEKRGAKASSLSSVEKRLNLIKESFSFTTNAQLIAYCKDRKII